MRTRRTWLAALALTLVSGCNQVDYIDINPKTLVLRQKNNEIWLQAHAMSHTGVHYSRTAINWSVNDRSIVHVDEKGRLTPLRSGHTEVVARTGSVVATTPVDVLYAEKMVVEPSELALVEGAPSVELKVMVFDYLGRELKDRTATFRSLDKEVVSMGQNAAFPVNAGSAKVEIRVEGLTSAINVVVAPEPKVAKKK